MNKSQKSPINWKSTLVLTLTPLAAMILVPYYALTYGFSVWDWFWFGFFIIATGLSITAGYHRLWSHRAYKANSFLKLFFMLFGAATLQNSIIVWASDHRKHHRYVDDKEKDPYAATKGFWYSHIGWMLRHKPEAEGCIENVKDLENDKIVAFQHRYYGPIAVLMCFGLPALIGASYGSVGGCLILVGLLRLVINHHFTFFINSLAHIWGKERYTDENTAKDNPLLSLLTFGEGYHNFHHKYAGDYRNGVLWYDYDPSKWLIFLASKIGWTYDLKRISKPTIEAARASMQFKRAQEKIKLKPYLAKVVEIEKSLEIQYKELFETIKQWAKAKQEHLNAQKEKLSAAHIAQLKQQYLALKKQFKAERRVWRATMSALAI
ncbi:Fatty acid desaturase [Piscirickettsia salmonis]|uniref:Fatty acid desaturase family protein n=1 Tax=Piscirickettsia salmonis TaxID=1238 RepID=A0A1L6TFM1_PISSA|nr:fatty acid desaturase [Piscirickettsia salmonis]AKP72245.1 stearoyl-CoA 9-desaturase [Piscirickettsia salmonis LF-89 = ATCC VR-1361]ALB24317.1 fatty acid desaturase family protein [Piscirickettsia salmonis]ALY04111.1 stearoyl-CoA 9-desaturase [Piscirickettsia salmonis]AMA43666.1 stearoyl-CoA 9-desaturase [Piscirickettsia salmonis]AOS36133.1 stearoyl-CoA 9-desaturase [Piscirickettsia salmonis]